MNYKKETGTFKSSNGQSAIAYYVYKPMKQPRAILQLSHGMCEYVERYEPFIDFLTCRQILVCGNDHLGHKNSAASKADLGYFARKNGYRFLPKDLSILTGKIKKSYPDLPVFLLGHSMGSFIVREYLAAYGGLIDGAIICGTSGSNPFLPVGKAMISLVKRFKGERYRSRFLDRLMFGQYNKKYPQTKTDKDWLTRDEKIVDAYRKDEYCMFLFTASAFYDLAMLLSDISAKSWYSSVPKDLPLFLISGDMDPVGGFGKGIREVRDKLKAQKLADFHWKFYKDYRHEILNEVGKEAVYEDILKWIRQRIR